jgi:hypothetical protein
MLLKLHAIIRCQRMFFRELSMMQQHDSACDNRVTEADQTDTMLVLDRMGIQSRQDTNSKTTARKAVK